MLISRCLATIGFLGVIGAAIAVAPHSSTAQAVQGPLARAKTIKCTFPLMVVGTWGKEKPEVVSKPTNETLEFLSVNADEGTAELKSKYGGKYDIIVRYANGYLHFIQSFLDGPLYSTTILEKKTASGKLKAMHSRHEVTDVSLVGFTSSPEQYYGECEILN